MSELNTEEYDAQMRRNRSRRANEYSEKGFADIVSDELIICILFTLVIVAANIINNDFSSKIWFVLNNWLSQKPIEFLVDIIEYLKNAVI